VQPEVGVSLEAVRAGKVPSSTLQTFKFEDDRGAAGGAAADEVERKVRLTYTHEEARCCTRV
jgi:hypothetical protein